MISEILMLAQDEVSEPSAIFNLRNGILLAAAIALYVGYKVYQKRTMS